MAATTSSYSTLGSPSAPTGPPVLHTAEEAALLLRVKQSWLERQAAARKIPFSMLGGSYRFTDKHLAEIVRMNEVTPALPEVDTPPRSSRRGRNAHGDHVPDDFQLLRPRPRKARQQVP